MLLVRRGDIGAVVGREGMGICTRLCSPVVAAMKELRDLLPGGGRGRVGGSYQLRFEPQRPCAAVGQPPLQLVYRLPPGLREHWPSWRCDHYGVKVLKRSC